MFPLSLVKLKIPPKAGERGIRRRGFCFEFCIAILNFEL
jgi:hypothetical protein